ncbi:ATP-dependent DNA helicase PIF1-like, partial [Camellia sinensis]|uniref:ATP-dependent DNA helicase PIF1-like n=1 Tax=Camellia sinensis TaxID=4442 RepID=UPI001036E4B3
MVSRHAFEAVDRTFGDILKNTEHCSEDRVFGGKLFVLGGDFRQILPVVPRGGREQTVEASLPKSTIWEHCQVLHLTRNMRVTAQDISNHTRHELCDFAKWIKLIPEKFVIKNEERDLHQLIDTTYPDFINNYQDMSYLKERGILAPKNSDVDEINSIMLSMLPIEMKTFNSADKLCPTESESNVQDMNPPELLHSLNLPRLPNHCLQLKVGTLIMLLRNVNQSLGLCNGTRLIVDKMGNRVIEARVITGSRVGEKVLLSRIVLTPSKNHTPFTMKGRQFPIKLAFAMTINKSQGQTLKNVGLYLPNPVFSHGQLYVALSRVTSPSGLKVLIVNKQGIPDDVTKNINMRPPLNLRRSDRLVMQNAINEFETVPHKERLR